MKKNISLFLTVLFLSIAVFAADPAIWTLDSRSDFLKGDARGISVSDTGAITLAPKLTEVFKTDQQFIWSSAADTSGNIYLGTGGDGKVFKVDASGKGSLLVDLKEMNVTALAIAKNGDLFAATSPDGMVYRISANGTSEVYFEPKEKYIWSLAALPDGSLAVGTGDAGKLYKVKNAGASRESSLLFDSGDTHIISLAVDAAGTLYAGSDQNGIVYRFGPGGRPYALMDSPLREIHAISIGPDGSVYALAVGDSAASAKTAESSATPAAAESKPVTIEKPNPLTAETPAKSRYDLSTARSAVYRLSRDGDAEIIWSSATVTGFSISAAGDGKSVSIGTSDKGRIYNVTNEGRETLELQTNAGQISTFVRSGSGLFATSSNQGSLFRVGPETVAEGTYDSAVLDTRGMSDWGRLWWRSSGSVSVQTRSGNTQDPDETWSKWSTASSDQKGTQISSPQARYFQWKAILRAGPKAELNEVNVSFATRNTAPEVLSIQVLPTNVGLIANPPVQVDPNIELSGMDLITFGIPNAAAPPRRAFQRGATSLQWTAEDRNGDKLVYDVYYKETNEAEFKLLRADIGEPFITIDGQSLADGQYVLKVVARDTPSNPPNLARSGERITEPVNIDNTPPTVSSSVPPQINGDKARVTFDAADSGSYIARAEYSVNGEQWIPIHPEDGISDGPKERYTIEIPLKSPGEYAVTIRVYDANSNAGNARAIVRR